MERRNPVISACEKVDINRSALFRIEAMQCNLFNLESMSAQSTQHDLIKLLQVAEDNNKSNNL